MKVTAALVREQGVEFVVVVVKQAVLRGTQAATTRAALMQLFPGVPVVLMAQDHRGTPMYSGRSDIVRFLANIAMGRLPWKEYTFAG